MEVEGKVLVVTGGGAGIGAALVREGARRGAAAVAVVDADGERARAVANEVGGGVPALAYACDVSSHDAVVALAEAVVRDLGTPGIVCSNAGVTGAGGPLVRMDPGDVEWVLGVNVRGVWNTCSVFGRLLRQAGAGWLLNTGSEHSLGVPHLGAGIYTAAKHAVLGLSDVLRREMAGSGVGVSVLCPGAVASQIWNGGRLRPEALGGPIAPRPGLEEAVAKGMEPALVAQLAFDGIARGAFVIATHPHVRAHASGRWDEVSAAFDHLDELALDLPDNEPTSLATEGTDP
jgi:NAD(P)-dependent dehydrogenase (short-subunit alcohol dehydrogenase family)